LIPIYDVVRRWTMGFSDELLSMWAARRFGFRVEESMRGMQRYLRDWDPGLVKAGSELPFNFHAAWGHPSLSRYLDPRNEEFLVARMEGNVTAGGLAGEAEMRGTLEIRYVQDASVRYRFAFVAQEGRTMRFEGSKTGIRPWNFLKTHTVCRGTVTEDATGQPLSDVTVRFNLADLPVFLMSLRPA
jgi:hypothetical protein